MNAILTVRDLSVHFRQGKRLVQLVDRVSFSVARGECLASWENRAAARA